MAKEYFKMWNSYLKSVEPLNDSERGRLFSALIQYNITQKAPALKGNERFLFPMMKENLDREREIYNRIVERNAENGKSGGRPKSGTNEKTQKNPNNPVGFYITQKTETSQEQEKEKDKEQDKEKDRNSIPPKSPRGDASLKKALEERNIPEPIKAELCKWFQYKKERKETYKPTGLVSFLTTVENKCAVYSQEDIISLMEESMANGWRGIIWKNLAGKEKPREKAPEKPAEIPPDLIEAKRQHEEAMEKFRAGKASWEDLLL